MKTSSNLIAVLKTETCPADSTLDCCSETSPDLIAVLKAETSPGPAYSRFVANFSVLIAILHEC